MPKYDQMHYEANEFAYELLMPEKQFIDFVNNKSNKISDIADHFGVPVLAVRERAKLLKFKESR